MSIRKRRLPSGRTCWQIDYRDQGGRPRSRQFASRALAVGHETKIRSEIASGVHTPDNSSITLGEAAALWLRRASTEQLERSTQRQYEEHTRLHVLPLLGPSLKLSRLSRPMVEQFRDKLLETRSRPLARAVLASLKGVLREAARRGLVGQNVAADVQIRISGRGKTTIIIPAKSELKEMIAKSAEL